MIGQRERTYSIVRQLEECLTIYQKTLDTYQMTPILNKLQEKNHHYDLDTIDLILDAHHSVNGAALELYDILFPPTAEEELQLSRERRRYILQIGII